jgi:hypothetical protein
MRKIHSSKFFQHLRIRDFLKSHLPLLEAYPVLYRFAEKYMIEVERADTLYLSIESSNHTFALGKRIAREKLTLTLWHKVIPYLTEVAIVNEEDQLLKQTNISKKALQYLSHPAFIKRIQKLVHASDRYFSTHPSPILQEEDLQKFKEQWQNYLSTIDVPRLRKTERGKQNREIIEMLRSLNKQLKKLEKLMIPFMDKHPNLSSAYTTAFSPSRTRGSRYAVLKQVLDYSTGNPIPGARVCIPELKQTRYTSSQGRLWIRKFPKGSYKAIITHPQYQTHETIITVDFHSRGKSSKIYIKPTIAEAVHTPN